jgi:hypothetical protein
MNGILEATKPEGFPPYPDSAAELGDHLLRLNGILRLAVQRFRRAHSIEQQRGLGSVAVFDEEVDCFLSAPLEDAPGNDGIAAENRLRCELRAGASAAEEIEVPVDTIRRRFGLCGLEVDALLLCLAAELHPGYGRVFAYLHNDLSRQRPSAALMVDILSTTWSERMEVRRVLSQRSPLFRFGLLVASRPGDTLATELAVDSAVLEFALGAAASRETGVSGKSVTLDDLLLAPSEREAVERTICYLDRTPADLVTATIVVLSGSPGVGRRSTASAICGDRGFRLRSMGKDAPAAALLANLPHLLRDARLAGDVPGVYIPRAAAEERTNLDSFIDAVAAGCAGLAFLFVDSEGPLSLGGEHASRLIGIHLGAPSADLRIAAWQRALHEHGLECTEEALSSVAAVYPFHVGRIYATVRDAAARSQIAGLGSSHMEITALTQACREQPRHQLDRLAQPIPIRHGWDDIVLPPDELRRLKEIADAVRNRDAVMDGWGFGRKVATGAGVNAVFFGPSGTGKTMAASILAGDLGMAIYRVDLSRVMSKYIGETERNLDELFSEARRSFALLFFDEADALFGKRSEVKDAHDRYANIEVSYLLQRMESFDGVAILATNMRKHIDGAFLRRLQFAVEFPLPTATERLTIWRQVWPAAANLGKDIDLDFMARHLELSGGHIRNVALMAAYLASQDRSPISMAHIVAATRREFQKLGQRDAPQPISAYAPPRKTGTRR